MLRTQRRTRSCAIRSTAPDVARHRRDLIDCPPVHRDLRRPSERSFHDHRIQRDSRGSASSSWLQLSRTHSLATRSAPRKARLGVRPRVQVQVQVQVHVLALDQGRTLDPGSQTVRLPGAGHVKSPLCPSQAASPCRPRRKTGTRGRHRDRVASRSVGPPRISSTASVGWRLSGG